MTRAALFALLILLGPRGAAACATCITSPFGDQTYNWAYVGLILTPFVLGGVIALVLTRCWLAARREDTETVPGDPITPEGWGARPPEGWGARPPEGWGARPPEETT